MYSFAKVPRPSAECNCHMQSAGGTRDASIHFTGTDVICLFDV